MKIKVFLLFKSIFVTLRIGPSNSIIMIIHRVKNLVVETLAKFDQINFLKPSNNSKFVGGIFITRKRVKAFMNELIIVIKIRN